MRLVLEAPDGIAISDALLLLACFLLFRIHRVLAEGLALQREQAAVAQKVAAEPASGFRLTRERRHLLAQPVERLLQSSAQRFSECMLGDNDVDVTKFISTCRAFTDVLMKLGSFTMLSIREVNSNMVKVEHTYLLAPERFRSMRALLEEEIANQMHGEGGVLADPSAAMGLLWARRGLMFWVKLFEPHLTEWTGPDGALISAAEHAERARSAAHGAARPPTPPASVGWSLGGGVLSSQGYADAISAFKGSLEPHMGWMTANTFKLGARATPDWAAFTAKLAPCEAELMEDVAVWSRSVFDVLERMDCLLTELDLQDQRKTI